MHVAGCGCGRPVLGVAVDGEVDVHADGLPLLFGDVPQHAGGAGKEREAAQHLHGQVEIGEGSAADPGAVQRQRTTEDLGVDPSDGLEQPQMRAADPFLVGEGDQRRGARVTALVDRVAETGDDPARCSRLADDLGGEFVPSGVVGWLLRPAGECVGEEPGRSPR